MGRHGPGGSCRGRGRSWWRRHGRREYGRPSKQGSDWLRWILCEAAQTAKRSPEFAASYQRLARRRGKKIATTAIARRLLARAYHLLRAVQVQHDRQGSR
ncbi:transposase [Streptomyces sp. NPDC047453]|uniref:transposase n=1 Tax=Streptomyces sp. NPDC047453 TaxID=3154812 RepID=UPI0033C50567